MANHENQLDEARDSVIELRDAIAKAVTALEELEGAISDTGSLENVTLSWGGRNSQPYIDTILEDITLIKAKFLYEFEESL